MNNCILSKNNYLLFLKKANRSVHFLQANCCRGVFPSMDLPFLCNMTIFALSEGVKILQIRILHFEAKYGIIYKLDVR